jgi:CHAT domain-containing protein
MATTPEYSPLACATKEIEGVKRLLAENSFTSVSVSERLTKHFVLQHLKVCQIFHFAGHGKEDFSDPSKSALLLKDWQTDPMTVSSVLDIHLSTGNPFLAYLSACQTGQVTQAKFRDENIHLISAYQLAGFRHVIGTLWVVNDLACVEMAKVTYQTMLEENITDESVCRGLHRAAMRLRNEWRKETRDIMKDGNDEEDTSGVRKVGLSDCSDSEEEEMEVEPVAGKAKVKESESMDQVEGKNNWIPYVHFGA